MAQIKELRFENRSETLQSSRSLIGHSPQIENVRRLIAKAARSRLPVLLLGETGTGKEVVARAIHAANGAPSGPGRFVPIDCGSLVGTLMESELFGHVKGSFSGAAENKKGLVEVADGGTAFFDEIGDLPLEMQVKLLRLIQESEFRAVGSLEWRRVDLRIIAATHRDLKAEVAAKRFREDLFYRLNVFTIHVPPLRERPGDIPLLIDHFMREAPFALSPEMRETLLSYNWPGNVRELKHSIERMLALHSEGALEMADLPSALSNFGDRLRNLETEESSLPDICFHKSPELPVISLPECERKAIQRALASTRGERQEAARLLGIGRTTLYRKMKQYGIA